MEFEIANVRVASQTILGADWSRARDHIGATGSIDARKRTENVATYWTRSTFDPCGGRDRGLPQAWDLATAGNSQALDQANYAENSQSSILLRRMMGAMFMRGTRSAPTKRAHREPVNGSEAAPASTTR